MPTPTSPRPRRRMLPRGNFDLDAAIDQAFLAGGISEARHAALLRLGWVPTDAQILQAVGRNAWRLGQERGNQTYQRWCVSVGRPMPFIDPDGQGFDAALGVTSDTASIDRGFGIEIEFNAGRRSGSYGQMNDVVVALQAAGVEAANYGGYAPHEAPTGWRMGTDVTVSGGELVSPILAGSAGLNEVREALRAVRGAGGVAGRNQGMHVHHDVRDHSPADLERLLTNLEHSERALLAYVPRSRWNGSNTYGAARQSARAWANYRADVARGVLRPERGRAYRNHYSRYVSVNINAVLTYGSVEFRALGNTLNGVKTRTWVRVGQALIWWGKQGNLLPAETSPEDLMALLVADGALPQREADRFLQVVADRRSRERVAA